MSSKRIPMIAGNWKMHMTVAAGREFLNALEASLSVPDAVEVALFPAYTAIYPLRQVAKQVRLGAQNMHAETEGAFTGEVSAPMLRELVDLVLVGHSERRHIFGEDDDLLNRKTKRALEHGLQPVLCVGETLKERDAGATLERINAQIEGGFAGIDKQAAQKIIVAYEPVWAIGTGRTATPQQAQEVHAAIRSILEARVPDPGRIRILYGGSVKPENSADLLSQPDIDGALVGGASLRVEPFSAIIHSAIRLNPA
ncbi:MAG TPA: triose-phosphate isomerase [Candidatus Aminicenantes bacterium]|nr:triose-phosphate isomerase [Candidatus Aminicenantes bacterium]